MSHFLIIVYKFKREYSEYLFQQMSAVKIPICGIYGAGT